MVTYYPLHYFTYNRTIYYQCIGLTILFVSFFGIIINVFKYEMYNKKGVCDPEYYYGSACKNVIANTVLADGGLVPIMNQFYYTVENQLDPSQNAQQSAIDSAGDTVQNTINTNNQFAQNTVEQIQEVTNVVQLLTTKYLGNLQQFLQTAKSTSSATWNQIQEIPGLLNSLQSQINQAIITPALARYVDPLQKLYQSLSAIQIS